MRYGLKPNTGPLIVPAALDACAAQIILSLVVPTLNESENIIDFLVAVRHTLDHALPGRYEVIVVDDDSAVLAMMTQGLERKGFEVVAASSVPEALRRITAESFDVLITDLHMPNPGDGFTVVSAMRHSQPNALTMLVSGYPDVQSAMAAILLEADEIVVKPFEIGRFIDLVREKVVHRKPTKRIDKESVGTILRRCTPAIVDGWLARAKQSSELNRISLSDEERTGHLPKLVEDLALVGGSEQGFATAWRCPDRIGIE
jgi:DNA-binding response OmpR family regulator